MFSLKLPFPPSGNHTTVHTNAGKHYKTKAFTEYVRSVAYALMSQIPYPHIPLSYRLQVEIMFVPPNRRLYDLDNRLKTISDALTRTNFWVDDSLIDHLTLIRSPTPDQHKEGYALVQVNQYQHQSQPQPQTADLRRNEGGGESTGAHT